MASLATHLSASLILVPTGLTRLLRSTSLFLKNPSLFKSKPWFSLSRPHRKNLDLFALTIALPIVAVSEALRADPDHQLALAHQASVLVLFWALVLLVALRECVDFLRTPVNDGLVFVLAGISFLLEYWISGNGTEGLSNFVYGLLGLLSLLCGACSLYLALNPSSFWAEFLLSSGLLFQGTWVLQIGLSLNTETFGFKGCGLNSKKAQGLGGFVECELEENGYRAVALTRLLFVLHSGLVFGLGIAVIGFLSLCQRRRSSLEGDDQDDSLLLSQLETETVV